MSSTVLSSSGPRRPGTALKARVGRFLANNGALVGLVVLCIALFIATPNFLTTSNLLNVGVQASVIAVMAFGVTFVIVAGGIDLSVGSVAALSGMISAVVYTQMGIPGWLALAAGLATGAAMGAISGVAVAFGKLPAFIATLAMLSVARGLTLVVSDGRPISTPEIVNLLGTNVVGVPMPIFVTILAALIGAFILNYTVIGREMYAVGGNLEAARLSGINVKKVLITVFVLAGLYAGLAGMLMSGRLTSAQPQAGAGYELDAIAAVVIGGASLQGGVGRITGTLVGALVLAVIRNGMNLLNVSSFWQQVVIGLVIAIAVGIDVLRRKNTRH